MELPDVLLKKGFRVAILSGGSGNERAVSLVSGKAVADSFQASGVPFDLFELPDNTVPEAVNPAVHLVLPVVHGSYGEDGILSAELASRGFAYAGCDQSSSVLCFDKLACKALASHIGLPVAADYCLIPGKPGTYAEVANILGTPFILKPRRDGSSVGLHLVRGQEDFEKAREDLHQFEYIAEAFIEGYDLTVGIIGGKALGVVAVHPEGGLYDYEHKYTSGLSRYQVPADLPEEQAEQLRRWSLSIYEACGCRDLARVDFRMGSNGEAVFLEVNTLPGMTPTSLLPKSAECCGITFGQLVMDWAAFALQRKGGEN